MDINQLNNWLKDIKVQNQVNADVEVVNNSPLSMLGKGRQGAVFQVSEDICVKVFGNEEDCEREHYALSLGKDTNLFPKIHAKGPLYIAMDIVRGVDIREYLQSQPLTESLSARLLIMLITFKKIGYERIDHHKRQIYLQPDGSLKVIDVARTVWRDRVYPYPRKLLTSLGEENKAIFLGHVKSMAPDVYEEWLHYIRMEEISHQIYEILLPEKPDKESLKNLSKQLLTTKDEEKYVAQLQGLVHKVFKEEWVKTMLARGKDPDTVMAKIDEYWDSREMEFSRDGVRLGDKGWDKNRKEGKRFVGESRRHDDKDHNRKRFEGEKYHERDRKNRPKNRKRHHS
ncbi:hypothetical protein RCG19_19950 [Neobacillus sp. OS1-2]|uniref:hypothetical protein n=1 Tax=Neobacillus sp. OS1-2 TaxID=3070680 RepID=UPI0027E0290F|nr:hypothetical protein [Neobacillus sp. OS1-2]WML39428.1 hypothetical protein RCG19_19950 [Neobacillus sp. OS1-2]